jgi:hypothetical protein
VPGQGTTFVVEFELAGEGADGLPEGAAVPTAA